MSFLIIAFKNLFHRRARSVLTIFGIAIGVQAMVALISISWGFQSSWQGGYTASGTDLIVARSASRNAAPIPFDENIKNDIARLPHIQKVAGMLSELLGVEDAPAMFVTGWDTDSFLWDHLKLVAGRWPRDDQENAVIIGTLAADVMGKKLGDTVQIELGTFKVVGIYESASLIESGAIAMRLSQMQQVTEDAGKVNFINVKLEPGTQPRDVDELRKLIKTRLPGMVAYSAGDIAAHSDAVKIAQGMSWATSVIALFVGGICIMNTALMSVFERTQEIGVLLAIGWRRRRIVTLILCESVLLSLFGGMLGIIMGLGSVNLLQATPMLKGKFAAETSPGLFLMVMAIALVLGVIGGLYPAYRASRLRPTEALRHE